MKKLIVVLMGAVLSLCLFGCSSGDQSKKPTDAEVIKAYSSEPAVDYLMSDDMGDRIMDVLDMIKNGDYDEAQMACVDANKKCDEVIDLDNVPDQAYVLHSKVREVANAYKDTFFCFELAAGYASSGDSDEAVSKLNEGTECYKDVKARMDEAIDLLDQYSK